MSVKESLFSWETGKDFVWMENSLYDGGTTYAILQDTEAPYTRYLYVMGMPSFGAGGAQKNSLNWMVTRKLRMLRVLPYIRIIRGYFMLSGTRCIISTWKGIKQNLFIWIVKRLQC